MLLFGLPCRIGEASAPGPTPAMIQSPEGLFAALIEVAEAVTRPDRTVEVHAAEPGLYRRATVDKAPISQGAEHGLIAKSARRMPS